MILTKVRKKRRRGVLFVFWVLIIVSIVMLFFPQIFNQTIAFGFLVGTTIAFFIKVLDWYEEGK